VPSSRPVACFYIPSSSLSSLKRLHGCAALRFCLLYRYLFACRTFHAALRAHAIDARAVSSAPRALRLLAPLPVITGCAYCVLDATWFFSAFGSPWFVYILSFVIFSFFFFFLRFSFLVYPRPAVCPVWF
jgi:hypothetical protein